jgi:replicative DNA helicase
METARSKVTPLRGGETEGIRTPPANTDAEQQLLGAILVNNAAFHRVASFLRPEHFAEGAHSRIYAAIEKMIERGQLASGVTLKNYFDQDGALAEIGGAAYLARLAASVVTIINVEDHARQIHDLHLRRQLITIGEDMVNDAHGFDLDKPASHQIEGHERRLFELATTGEFERGFRSFREALKEAIDQAESAFKRSGRTTGVPTGFVDLDKLLGGLHPSDLVVIAGRPSMGKTAIATNIGFNAARAYRPAPGASGAAATAEDGARVGFFSLEMSSEQLATRILAEESGVSSNDIRKGEVSRDDLYRFIEASQRLSSVPFFIDDTPALSIAGLRTRARRLRRIHGLDLIIVDYLQLIRGTGDARGDNRVQEISEITRGLKTLAKELDLPVIALSQLSRAVEQREDKRPMLSDLRESGSIEQDADVVMFVFREEYYLARSEPVRRPEENDEKFGDRYERWHQRLQEVTGTAELMVAKQRHGPIGSVKLRFDHETTRFESLMPSDRMPDAI